MPQVFSNKITTSLFGFRFGLQAMSTAITGGRLNQEFLVGPDGIRAGVTTAESTGTNLLASGISNLTGTSAASSAVYVLDPPIPGVPKMINIGTTTDGPIYVRTANSETFNVSSSLGSSFTTIKSSVGGAYQLVGLTTAVWTLFLGTTAAHILTTST